MKKIKEFIIKLVKIAFIILVLYIIIGGIVGITRNVEADKWSKLLDETRALIPKTEPAEKIEDTIKRICDEEGVPWITCILVANCESKFDKFFKEKMRLGYDRGVFAINSYHYKNVSDECAFDISCATKVFAKAYNTGKQGDWLCYKLITK